jgi:hexosaminidase
MENVRYGAREVRAVHLDLKGLSPTPSRLIGLLPIFAHSGYNAILVEWEDSFPWTVDKRFRSKTAYTPEVIHEFHARAKSLKLEIIPLVQSIGHMETFLGHADYVHLREKPDYSDVLNPLSSGATTFVTALMQDVLDLSENPRYFHLGGDEAWCLGTNPQTQLFVSQYGKDRLYIDYIEPLLDILLKKGIRPLLWHDMMIDWDDQSLLKLKDKADLVVWGYGDPPTETTYHYSIQNIERFHKIGLRLWGATAYKGADGNTGDLPNQDNRNRNAAAWMPIAEQFNFVGMIATAWSRYSTHRPQNEPIDAALHALISVGQIISNTSALNVDFELLSMEILEKLGEYQQFKSCHDTLMKYSKIRSALWQNLQYFWEQIAIEKYDSARRTSNISTITLKELELLYMQLEDASEEVSNTFKGLIESVWIDEYLIVRRDAILPQLELAKNELAKYKPHNKMTNLQTENKTNAYSFPGRIP